MKRLVCAVLIAAVLSCLVSACADDETAGVDGIVISLTAHTGCKSGVKSGDGEREISSGTSCIDYSYSPDTWKLTLTHINAGFNCCPESLFCHITLQKDTIVIEEKEKSALCKCDCLYDLDMVVTGLPPGVYHIRISEPYLNGQHPIAFQADLKAAPEGRFCVARDKYPWEIQKGLGLQDFAELHK